MHIPQIRVSHSYHSYKAMVLKPSSIPPSGFKIISGHEPHGMLGVSYIIFANSSYGMEIGLVFLSYLGGMQDV